MNAKANKYIKTFGATGRSRQGTFLCLPASLTAGHLDFWTPAHLSPKMLCKRDKMSE